MIRVSIKNDLTENVGMEKKTKKKHEILKNETMSHSTKQRHIERFV